ncbi:MAG: alanine racemase, partial [Allosphingosinicella sp.]
MIHRPLRLKLDGEALVANWRWLAKRGGATCGAAIKADGYGLGAREVVARLAAAGCRDYFVATWAEAEALMPWAGNLSLSVLHGVGPDDLPVALASSARPVLNSAEQISRWRDTKRPCDVMVDTGINRLGLSPADAGSQTSGLKVATLMSHLACADEDVAANERQRRSFLEVAAAVPADRLSLANSAGICLG